MKAKASPLAALLIGFTIFGFQNCGEFAPASGAKGGRAFAALSSASGRLWLETANPRAGSSFDVGAETGAFSPGSELYWDHEFSDGTTFCIQTSSPDRSQATFQCPSAGLVRVTVIAIAPDGQEDSESLEFTVASADGQAPPPPSSSGSGAAKTGEQLYNSNCSGCHGPLAMSTKRGATLTRLNSSILNVGVMASLRTLTTAERQAIVTALQ